MDVYLKLLADASLSVDAAESSITEGAVLTAAESLDGADGALAELRAAWPGMSAGERAVVARPAGEVRTRMDAARRRLPKVSALSEGTPESDPDEDEEPPVAIRATEDRNGPVRGSDQAD